LAVCDVFLCAIEKLRSNFKAQKNVAEKNRTKGVSPTAVFRSPSRPTGGEAHTDLLGEVKIDSFFINFFDFIIPFI
jgi:hypothetical protein